MKTFLIVVCIFSGMWAGFAGVGGLCTGLLADRNPSGLTTGQFILRGQLWAIPGYVGCLASLYGMRVLDRPAKRDEPGFQVLPPKRD